MGDELRLTLDALEELYDARRASGWELRVYDYTSNSWRTPEEAFSTPGAYERAVLVPPGGRPVRVRLLPPGAGGLAVDAGSAGELAVWRALGVDLQGRHAREIASLLKGHQGPVPLEEVLAMLFEAGESDATAREAGEAIRDALGHGGGDQ